MSLFARLLILANAGLTLLLVGLLGLLLAQQTDYRILARREAARAERLDAEALRAEQDAAALTGSRQAALARRLAHTRQLEARLSADRALAVEQRGATERAQREVAALEQRAAGAAERTRQLTELRRTLSEELRGARGARDAAGERRRAAQAARVRIEEQALALRALINALSRTVIDLARETGQLRRLVEWVKRTYWNLEIAELVPLLDGRVVGVTGDLLRLDRGRDHGIELGWPFTIARGPTFVAWVRVVRVDKEGCTAQIVPSRSPGTPRPGDLATTRIPD